MSFPQDIPLVPGHVQSNEPAFYETGEYGIRIESVIGVKEVTTRRSFEDKRWFGFERFTTVRRLLVL
jgi:Xaa-Pro aminopeptidase